MVSFVLWARIIVVISSLSLLSLLSMLSVPSSSDFSIFHSAFGSIPSLDKATTEIGDQASNSRSTTNNEQVTNSNNTDALRTYTNTAFNLTVKYPPTWGVMELKTNRFANSSVEVQRSSPVAVILSPLENKSDKFQEKMLIGVQNLLPSRITLQDYTKSNLNAYRNQSDIKILESSPTTLGGQPAHRIVYTDDSVKGNKLKNIQVWTVINNSKAYVITFGSEESKYNDYLSDAQNILSSFKITTGSSDNSSQEQRNHLTFYDPMFGVKLEYPSSWTKTQPGLPLDNRTLVFIVSFIAPRPAISIPDNENNSSSNSSAATINVGINDLARFISGKRNSPTSFNNNNTSNNTGNTGNRDLTLAEYSSRQVDLIKQLGAELRSSIKTNVAGLPGQQVYYVVGKGLLIIQAWTLNGGKAYHIVLSANDPDDFMANLPVFHEMVKSMKFQFNSTKTNRGG